MVFRDNLIIISITKAHRKNNFIDLKVNIFSNENSQISFVSFKKSLILVPLLDLYPKCRPSK